MLDVEVGKTSQRLPKFFMKLLLLRIMYDSDFDCYSSWLLESAGHPLRLSQLCFHFKGERFFSSRFI